MYMPINPLGYSCIKKLQRDNLWHAYNEPINIYSVWHRNISHEDICYILSTQTIMLQNTVYKWFEGAEKRHVCLVHNKTTE